MGYKVAIAGATGNVGTEILKILHERKFPVSDVYALGCTLYYAVTGKVPFPGGNTPDKIRRHLDETPLNPLHFNPDLPTDFCDAIAAMQLLQQGTGRHGVSTASVRAFAARSRK